jgi:hypothetical protein
MTFAFPDESESSETDSILKAVIEKKGNQLSAIFISGPGGLYYMRIPFLSRESTWISIVNYVENRIVKSFCKFESPPFLR